ncbi:MAG TPA: zinc-binding alcohol dehydrogenase [Rhizobiaceae bacterium]|nr:zinc-binding alcohol dehydrogenase [Rhizobiaceae bacterium]
MSEPRVIQSLGVRAPYTPYFMTYEEGPLPGGHVRLETLFSGLSAGTELTFLKNSNPYLHSRWDEGRGVFVDGEPSAHFPIPFLGYMEVATISESDLPTHRAGDIVCCSYAHKSGHTANPFHELLVPLPQSIEPMLGVFVAQMGPIAANGILHADAELFGADVRRLGEGVAGRPVLVIGAGPVGVLTALFARDAGASVVIADPSSFRRQKAEELGIAAMEEEAAWQHAKAAWHHGASDRGADIVFQTRARSESLHTALRALRPQGTVIDLAFYQGVADRTRLGEEFHHNGLAIRCAQIGRVPRGMAHLWDRRRLALETIALLSRHGEAIRRAVISHVVPIRDAPAFLEALLRDRPDFLQIVFSFER